MTEGNIEEYKVDVLSALNFHIVFCEDDLDKNKMKYEFKPQMAHQVFGEGESIFGYKDLTIDLYYLHNSSKCYMSMKYSDKVKLYVADEVIDLLNPWMPSNYSSKVEEFRKMVQHEKHDQIFGDVIHTFEKVVEGHLFENLTCQYKVTLCDAKDPLFQEYHQRFETFIIWFIDAANFIDLSDERWIIYYIYEEFKHPESNEIFVTPIGYTAIYKFFSYPSSNRARISQFFILPTHQKKGLGTELYKAVYKNIVENKDIIDITVEEPNESFQKMRDICDSLHIYKDLKDTDTSITTKSPKLLTNYMSKHKISKKQGTRVADILQFYTALKSGNGEVKSFSDNLLKRMKVEIEKEFNSFKIARGSISEESLDPILVMKEQMQVRYSNYTGDIKSVAEKLLTILK